MIFKNYRTVLGITAPLILISLSFVIVLATQFSVVAFIIALYINLILLVFSVFVIVRVSQQNTGSVADDFMEYWKGEDDVIIQVGIRVFTTRVTKMVVWQRDNGRCVKCRSGQNLEFKYIIPLSKGGSNTHKNIHLVCQNCNLSSVEITREKTLE